MIGVRTPFRISFLGGGSDLKEFYQHSQGMVLSAAINKSMYIFVHKHFTDKIQVKYSKTEIVDSIDEIAHPIVREVLRMFGLRAIDINSIADIPAGTGLGSSSSFTVGLFHALYTSIGETVSPDRLAREACEIEINILGEPIGKQDQYAAAFGGLNMITFYPDEQVKVKPLLIDESCLKQLEENLLMFYTGITRHASHVLTAQKESLKSSSTNFKITEEMAALANIMHCDILNGNIHTFGSLMNEGWKLKSSLNNDITNSVIDEIYDLAIKNGAEGGKLLGAGGGGFLLFYCKKENQEKLRRALGAKEMDFGFEKEGSKVVFNDGR